MRCDSFIYTIYDHPRDYPDSFVARRWDFTQIDGAGNPIPGPIIAQAPTLEAVRAQLPPGLTCIGAWRGDDHSIVETWL